ncbi:DegQ family regulator [Bacillus safensis]|uniref:DegQ family regulator n=1 Tax=Bacillus safensis TaxID=561879 RepID=UPI0033956D9D
MTQSPYTNTLIFQKRRVESMEKYEIEELKQLLWKLEKQRTKQDKARKTVRYK